MRRPLLRSILLACCLAALPTRAEDPAPKAAPEKTSPAPLPPDAHFKSSVKADGKVLPYTMTIGTIPVFDEKDKRIADVVYTAYTLDGAPSVSRPVTFGMNGGPGSASLWLNILAMGPRIVDPSSQNGGPSAPVRLIDNPSTWLAFSDLVFIDAVGTGVSRALVPPEEARKPLFSFDGDVAYLSRVIVDWLRSNHRMTSPKFLVGESYSGSRMPHIALNLATEHFVGIKGMILISPMLDGQFDFFGHHGDLVSLYWVGGLPSLAAARLEREGRLTPEAMAPIESFASTEYLLALTRGWSDPQGLKQTAHKVAELTGLDPDWVLRQGGRIDPISYIREVRRSSGEMVDLYDAGGGAMPDPFPWDPRSESGDLIAIRSWAPSVSAWTDLLDTVVQWRPQGRYLAWNPAVPLAFQGEDDRVWATREAWTDIRKLLAMDQGMGILIAHGYSDLSCPYYVTKLQRNLLPPTLHPERVQLLVYPGGHMPYLRPGGLAALTKDARKLYEGH